MKSKYSNCGMTVLAAACLIFSLPILAGCCTNATMAAPEHALGNSAETDGSKLNALANLIEHFDQTVTADALNRAAYGEHGNPGLRTKILAELSCLKNARIDPANNLFQIYFGHVHHPGDERDEPKYYKFNPRTKTFTVSDDNGGKKSLYLTIDFSSNDKSEIDFTSNNYWLTTNRDGSNPQFGGVCIIN